MEPVTMMAVGYPDSPGDLPEVLRKRELRPRIRKEIEEFVCELK